MRNRLVTLLVLLVFCGSLLAGPHPCHARGAAPEPVKQSKSACHHTEPAASNDGQIASSSGEGEDGCCAGKQGAGCEHACQMVALIGVQTTVFAVQPQTRLVAPTFDRSLPLFAPPIDHIPLA